MVKNWIAMITVVAFASAAAPSRARRTGDRHGHADRGTKGLIARTHRRQSRLTLVYGLPMQITF